MNRQPFHDLSVVVPARNEAVFLGKFLEDLTDALPGAEFIVVDNCSTDDTAAVVTESGRAQLVQEFNPGKGHAMRAGAAAATRDILLFHDADLEYQPTDAVKLVEAVRAQPKVMAVGARTTTFGRPAWSSLFASGAVRQLLRWRWGEATVGQADVLCGTRALKRQLFQELRTQQAGFRIETEITRLALRRGMALISLPVRYDPRTREEGKKIRPGHLWGILLEALL